MIVVAGDSWACGEFDNLEIPHRGITEYLINDGFDVCNVGKPGGSLFETIFFLRNGLQVLKQTNQLTDKSFVLMFQTEWHRDFKIKYFDKSISMFYDHTEPVHLKPNAPIDQSFIDRILSHYYQTLSELAQTFFVPIYLIGGVSDTIWFDQFSIGFPGLTILCQSLTEFIVNDSTQTINPVFSALLPEDHIKVFKKIPKSNIEFLFDILDQGIQRHKVWQANPGYFWPDGMHANRKGHLKLYQLIRDQLLTPKKQ